MATQMATTRQPFAPLNGSRLQNLGSLKNRQNAITNTLTSPTKRKAAQSLDSSYNDINNEDSENIDPIVFLSPKRAKYPDGSASSPSSYIKPQNFLLAPSPPSKPTPVTSPRKIISPVSRIDTTTAPSSAPAGRSPTRKRIGILNRRRTTASPFTRIDPPRFSPSTGLGFSIDAALSGTRPSYTRPTPAPIPMTAESISASIPVLHTAEARPSWFFEIHEDTEEELATNLMEHGACTLDISSDEESAMRERDARGKENVPPPDDVSQTRTTAATTTTTGDIEASEEQMSGVKSRLRAERRRRDAEEGKIEIDRSPLGDLAAEDFYEDLTSTVVIPAEEADQQTLPQADSGPVHRRENGEGKDDQESHDLELTVDELMQPSSSHLAPRAALLQPIEKAEEGFHVWESGSAKGDD